MDFIADYFNFFRGLDAFYFYGSDSINRSDISVLDKLNLKVKEIHKLDSFDNIDGDINKLVEVSGINKEKVLIIISDTLIPLESEYDMHCSRDKCLYENYKLLVDSLYKYGYKNVFTLSIQVHKIIESTNDILKLYDYLSDEKSKDVLKKLIYFKFSYALAYIRDVFDKSEQYFPDDILRLNDFETFVDAGACYGETLKVFLDETEFKFNKALIFEPDVMNFKVLKRSADKLIPESVLDRIELFNFALSDEQTKVKLKGKGSSAFISEDGNREISTIPMDLILHKEPVTFVKMDIEGSELKALEGAKNIIMSKRPKLAICVYHNTEDLWLIPLYLNKLVPEYKLYLRHHDLDTPSETVCYAVED